MFAPPEGTSKTVKECLKTGLKKIAKDKINECLKDNKVNPISDDETDNLDVEGEKGTRPELDKRL